MMHAIAIRNLIMTNVRSVFSARCRSLRGLTIVLLLATIAPQATAGIDPPLEVRSYDVQLASSPPTIDGEVSPGEWDAAADGGGDWRLLREGPLPPSDAHENQFRLLWDDTALYLMIETNYGGWRQRPAPNAQGRYPLVVNGSYDAFSVFFDPNTDGEPNFQPGFGQQNPTTVVDGYEIAFNLYEGSFFCGGATPCTPTPGGVPVLNQGTNFGTFGEAHVNTLFGNQAQWTGMRGTELAQQTGTTGGVVELKIPWSDIDADASETAGLNHPFAPQLGDTWFFQLGSTRTDSSNFLPVWNWTASNYFAAHPHGEITFRGTALQADFDEDGDVDGNDFLIWQASFWNADGNREGDADGNGIVDRDDFLIWQEEFPSLGSGATAPIPEQATGSLALLAIAGLVAISGRKNGLRSPSRGVGKRRLSANSA